MIIPSFCAVLIICVKFALCAPVWEVELNKSWELKNGNGSIIKKVNLPSGVYSAFNKNNPEEVLLSYNDVNMRWIAQDNWTYSRPFNSPDGYEKIAFVYLTFHGIDTVASIKLNNKLVGTTNNMFVRYSYNIKDLLNKEGENFLEVSITSPIYAAQTLAANNNFTPPAHPPDRYHGESHMNFLRKMQASFSWDWGPAAPSMGIWKPVILEIYDIAIIRDVDVAISRNEKEKKWELDIRVFLETGLSEDIYGELTIHALDILENAKNVHFDEIPIPKDHVIRFTLSVPEEKVRLWWPNGYGEQKLYHLHFTWNGWLAPGKNPRSYSVSQKSIRIGFRTIELIQDAIGDTGDSFYFKVNGVAMFMKGSNYIPSHILPELGQDPNRIRHLLESAKDANMNMIRLWGGGVYESDYFYDMADYLGILIWHDMMFACAMYPVYPEFLESVREEVVQNAKRIAYHPSIAIFAANNENEAALVQNWYGTNGEYQRFAEEYRKLYVDTVYKALEIVAHKTRPETLMSSPSNGKISKDNGYISKKPQDPNYGDIHFYDYLKDGWSPAIYQNPRFSSEYGFQSLPSVTAWKRVLGENDDIQQLINHRQHHPLGSVPITGLILRHLPLPLTESSEYLESFVYFSQLSQAMATKIETEVYRRERNTTHNTMGALYWQLNDVWIAPSWSSIDFNGNYKILQYWAKDFLAPISLFAHLNKTSDIINIYIARDTIDNATLTVEIVLKIYLWSELFPKKEIKWPTTIEPNSAKLTNYLKLNDFLVSPFTKNNCFFEFTLWDDGILLSTTYFFPDFIKKAVGMTDPNIELEVASINCVKAGLHSVSLTIKVHAPAVFVYLEVEHENITTYKLSRNGFIQTEPIQTVHLEFNSNACQIIQARHIKVLTVNQFMKY